MWHYWVLKSCHSLYIFSLSFSQESMDEQEREKMREASKRLYAQMQDAEKKHQEERDKLMVCHIPPCFSVFSVLF